MQTDFGTEASRDRPDGVVRVAMPGRPGAAARAQLPLPQRRKLESLEAAAATARAAALALSDRLREAREELRQHEAREAALREASHRTLPGRWVSDPERGPTATTWVPDRQVNPEALASLLGMLRQDVERLEAERPEIDDRARVTGTLASRARTFLGLE